MGTGGFGPSAVVCLWIRLVACGTAISAELPVLPVCQACHLPAC